MQFTKVFHCPCCDHPHEIEVEVTSLGHPGQTYGPPEHCYPPEGPEFDFEFPAHCESETPEGEEDCEFKAGWAPGTRDKFEDAVLEEAAERAAEYDDEPDYPDYD